MRKSHRILAMILALVTVWTVLPLSVLADTWVEANTENEATGSVSSTTVTLSVDPETLLTYLKTGDKSGLLEGISLSGLREALDKNAMLELFSEEEIREVAGIIMEDLKLEELLEYVDLDALIAGADMDALIALIKELPDLQNYVLDYDKLMSYLDEEDLLGAIDYVDVDALIHAHVDELADLTLELDAEKIADLVDIAEVVELDGVDFFSVLNRDFIENTIGYDALFHSYIDEDEMIDYLHHRFHDLKHELHLYIKEAELEEFLAVHGKEIVPYLDFAKLQTMLAGKIKDYADVEIFLNKPVLYGLIRDMEYASIDPFVNEELAKKLVIDEELIDPKKLVPYIDMSQSTIDMNGLLNSSLITDDVVNALFDGGAIDLDGKVDTDKAKSIIIDGELIEPEELLPYVDLYQTDIDVDALMNDGTVVTDTVREKLLEGGAIDSAGNVDRALAKKIILDQQLIEPKALLPFFELGNSALDMTGLMKSSLITAEIYRALEDGGAVVLTDCVDLAKAKQIILDEDLIDLKALVEYVELDSCKMDTAGMMADTALMTDDVYGRLIGGGAVDVQGMVSSDQPLFSLDTLNEKGAIDISEMITHEHRLFDVWELEDAEVIDFETILVGDPAKGLPGLNPDWLVKEFKVFDLREMLSTTDDHAPLFTIEELAAEGIVLLDEMAADYGYDNIVDVNSLKAQVLALPDKTPLIDCILDPVQVIRTVGVKHALDATGESYSALINNYVNDKGAFFEALGADALLLDIAKNGDLEKIFDLRALAEAIGFGKLLDLVDIRTVIRELIESGALKKIVKAIDPDTYLSALTYATGVLEKHIYEISIEGVVITQKDGNLLFIDPALLADTVLDELLPELDDLVNLGDDGRVFSAELSVTYSSEATNYEKKTKVITLNAELESGVDRVRNAAARAKVLLERFLVYDINDGLLTLDLRLPGQFATVLRVALEKLSTSGDPALEALKDEILDLYDANVNDVSAFLGALTLEQVVALLNMIDASKFSEAYAKVMTNRYVEILLSYVKEATGRDFTDLTPEDLLIKAGELPTVEELCEKLEARLGREIEQLDRLPEGEPVEILERLAARGGIDVDIKQMLKDAAASEDPLATLYELAVARIAQSGEAYELIRGRVTGKLNRLLESRVGEKLSVLHLDDLYDGDGVFKYAKSITVDPMVYVRRLAQKGLELLDQRTTLPAETAERAVELFLSYFLDGTELSLGVDATLRAEDIYRIEFYEETDGGALRLIRKAFLPVGTDLTAVQPYETDSLHTFVGWKEPATGEIHEKMPARDVQVVAKLDDNVYRVYFYAWDSGELLLDVLTVNAGESLGAYRAQMNAVVCKYLDQQIPDKNIQWKHYSDGTEFADWDAPVTGDVALTWMHYYDVALVDPADGLVKQTLTVPAGTVLASPTYLDAMNGVVRRALAHPTLPDANIKWLLTGTAQEYSLDSKVNADLSLSWDVSYRIKIMDPAGNATVQTLTVPHGATLSDCLDELNAIVRGRLGLSEELLPDANIEWYDWADTTKTSFDSNRLDALILSDGEISWKSFFDVTVLDPDTDAEISSLRVPGGDLLGNYLDALNQIVKDALSQTHPNLADKNIVWFDAADQRIDFEQSVNAPLSLTWKLGFTVALVMEGAQAPYHTMQLVRGERLWDYLDEMNNALRNELPAQAITNDNIEWFIAGDPLKTVLDEAALKSEVVSDLELRANCYFTFEILDEDGDVMDGLSFRVPYGEGLTAAQIAKIHADVLKYVNETLGLDYITAEDITFNDGTGVFDSWNATLNRDVTLHWTCAEYYQVEVYAPDALGGGLVHTLNVLGGHKISEADLAAIRAKIRSAFYSSQTDLPDADIILINAATGENFGTPEISGDVKITWRLAEYYDVEIFYENKEGVWTSRVFVAREGNLFHSSWSEYANIIALRDEIAGTAPEDYEFFWLLVDENGKVTDEEFREQTAIKQDLRLTWSLRYNAVRYSLSIVHPDDPETVLWSADGLKKQTHVITYLSEQRYGETEQTVWEWLQALVAADDPHLVDYVHEYRLSWRKQFQGGSGAEILLDQYKMDGNLVLTWKYTQRFDNASLGVVGAAPYTGNPEVDDYTILHEDGEWVIRFKDQWFEGRPTEFLMAADFLENAIAVEHGVRFDATDSEQAITLSPALLAKLYAVAKVQGVDVNSLTLRYAPDEGKSVFDFPGNGAAFFTLDFYLNGSESGQVIKLGDFDVAHDPENDVFADVMITLPFAELVANGNGIKTFVCFEEDGENGKRYAKYELASYDLDAMTVTFAAPHFSSVAISNQYKISTVMPHLIQSGISADLLGKLPTNEEIAFYPVDLSAEEYYPAGYQVPIRGIVGKDDHLTKIDITRTLALGYDGNTVDVLPVSGTYTMPAQPIELCFEIAPKIYYVYYYVDGALRSDLTQAYTVYMIETPEEAEALKKKLLSLDPLGEGYSEDEGWSWKGFDDRLLGTADMFLSLVRATSEDSVAEKTVDVIYYAEDGVTVLQRVTYKLSALVDPSVLPTVESLLGPDTDATRTAYWVNLADGLRVPADYTADAWLALLTAGETISLRVAYTYRSFAIFTDGNVKVSVGDVEVSTAKRGTELTVTPVNTAAGRIPNVLIKTASGEIVLKSVGEGAVSFVMPAEDVMISVTYTAPDTEFVGPDGDVQSGTLGELKTLPPIVIGGGMSIDLSKVPSELILVDAVKDGNDLVLTYQYALTEGTDAKALYEALLGEIKTVEYRDLYVIDGKIFENADDALAYIQNAVNFKDWSDTVDKNLHFGSFEQATEEFPWIVIWILLGLLLLILLIALFYLLYVRGVLKPNLFLKVITAIVSVFFALCMALAAAWLAILRLFGVDEDRLTRKYPMLRRKGKKSLDETLETLRTVDPNYEQRKSAIDEAQISQKSATVVEELEINDEVDGGETSEEN